MVGAELGALRVYGANDRFPEHISIAMYNSNATVGNEYESPTLRVSLEARAAPWQSRQRGVNLDKSRRSDPNLTTTKSKSSRCHLSFLLRDHPHRTMS